MKNYFSDEAISLFRRAVGWLTSLRGLEYCLRMVGAIYIEKTAVCVSAPRLFYVQITGTSEGANLLYRTSRFYSGSTLH